MSFNQSALFLLLLIFPTIVAASPVQILSKTPLGRSESRSTDFPITVTFNQPMVALSAPQEMGDLCPLRVTPLVEGRCRWQGTQTLTFEPKAPWTVATNYQVSLPVGLKSQVTGETLKAGQTWNFETLRPALIESKPRNEQRWVDLKDILYLRFNMAMESKKARNSISLEEIVDGIPTTILVAIRRAKADEVKAVWPYSWYDVPASTATVLAVLPTRAMKPNAQYRLILSSGLKGQQGDLGLETERAITFQTWTTFRFVATEFPSCWPGGVIVQFTNPLNRSDLLRFTTVDGSTAPTSETDIYGGVYFSDRQTLPLFAVKPRESHTFTLSKNLPDKFGNLLGEDKTIDFTVPDYCPRVDLSEGFGVLEGYLPPRHPVTVVNMSEIPLAKKRIDDDELIPFYHTIRRSGYKRALDEPTKPWITSDRPNARLNTFLDFSSFFPEGTGGFAYAEMEVQRPWDSRTRWAKALDNITRVGVSFKSSPDSSLLWATYLRTGSPAKDMPVEIRSDDNRVLWTGRTRPDGVALAPGWVDLGISTWNAQHRPRLWAFVKDPKGTAGLSIDWRGGLEPWRLGVPYEWRLPSETYRGLLFTERGVYRPGETVYLKGLLRRLLKGDWTAMDKRELQLMITDARGQEVLKTTVTLSDLSSFDFAYSVPESAPTGQWTAQVTEIRSKDPPVQSQPIYEDEEGYYRDDTGQPLLNLATGFRVEAFKPATFEVHATPEKDAFMADEKFSAVVDGWYLFGTPMAGQPVQWKVRLQDAYYRVPGFDDFSFSSGWWNEPYNNTDQLVASADGQLNDQGKLNLSVPLPAHRGFGPKQILLEASVTNPERQRLFGRASALVHGSDLYLGLRGRSYFIEKSKSWTVDVVALHPDGQWAKDRPLIGRLTRKDWQSVRRAGVGNRWEWVTEQRDVVVATVTWTSDSSTRSWTFTPELAGQHCFTVIGQDEKDRPAQSALSFYVTGHGESAWAQNDTDILELVPEKRSYATGDVARILVKSPYPKAQALITVEREGVLDQWVTLLEGGAPTISVPISDKHLPNIFVGVMLVRGRTGENSYDENGDDLAKPQIKVGYASLNVSPASRRLSVLVKTDKEEYRPGAPVTVFVETHPDPRTNVSSEITVAVVDEGVLALTGFGTPDPFMAFYGPRPLRIDTADNRLNLIGQRNFGEKGENRGGGGGPGMAMEGIDLRSKFIPTVYWNGSIRTDSQGRATARFTLPDNLTRFRVMVVAQDQKRFGSGDTHFVVKKPLLMKPSLPRFARVGDKFEGGVVVHNYTDKPADVLVSATTEGDSIERAGDTQRTMTVPPGKAQEVLWTFRATKLGETRFAFRAASGEETDGLLWPVPVRAPERFETVATSNVTEKESVEVLRHPADAEPGLGKVKATLASSALVGLQEGAQFLLEYPYGCLEQQMSRTLPIVVGADLVETFGLGSMKDLKAVAQKALDNLPAYQHPSGGYRYWSDSLLPDPYITAYALEVTALAKREAYHLPEESIARAINWLRDDLGSAQTRKWAYPCSVNEQFESQAYAVHALALHNQPLPNYFSKLFQVRDQIPYGGKAYLLKAGKMLGASPEDLSVLAEELLNQSKLAPTTMHFEEPIQSLCWIPQSNVKTTALTLQALLDTKGGFPNDDRVIRWLTQERKIQGRWRTTHENAAALWAFQDYYRRYESEPPDFVGRLDLEDAPTLWSVPFKGRSLVSLTKEFAPVDLFGPTGNESRLAFRKEGLGRLYYVLRYAYAPAGFEKSAEEGFSIDRQIKPLIGGKELKAGDRAVVTLRIKTAQERTFVVLEDQLPGGFEVVDPSFAVEGQEQARAIPSEGNERDRYWGEFQRVENYDDRVGIFADYLTAGEHTYSYLIQATTPGQFHWPTARIEGMYEPEVFGRTASATIEIEK